MGNEREAVIVTRVSGAESARSGTSLQTQLESARAKARELGLVIVAEYEDAGISGAFYRLRDGMLAAIEDIKTGRATTLITYSIDRYSRDVEHQHRIKREVETAGGRLVFCNQEFEESPEGDFTFTILGGHAAYERQRIRKRCMDGRRSKAESGTQPCRTRRPYGYVIPTSTDALRGKYSVDQLGSYVIIPEQAQVVQRIYSEYQAGATLKDVCRSLNDDRIPTPQAAAYWSPTTVRSILSNPVYKGTATYGKTSTRQDEAQLDRISAKTGRFYKTTQVKRRTSPEEWVLIPAPPIVSENQWNAAQVLLKQNKKRGGNPIHVRMLTPVIRCSTCNGGMRISGSPGYYCCARHEDSVRAGAEPECDATHFRVDEVEHLFITALQDAAGNADWVPAAEAALHSYATQRERWHGRSQIDNLKADLKRLEEREVAIVKAQIDGVMAGMPADAYNHEFRRLAEERKAITERIRNEQEMERSQPPPIPHRSPTDLLGLLMGVLASDSVPRSCKRDLIFGIVNFVEPLPRSLRIQFKPGVMSASNFVEVRVAR